MLTQNQQRALRALARCPTRRKAAKEAGISERSLNEYFRKSEFRAAVREMYSSMLDEVTRRGQQQLMGDIDTWMEIRDDAEQPAAARIAAARWIHEYTLKCVEMTDIVQRLDELEERQNEQQHY